MASVSFNEPSSKNIKPRSHFFSRLQGSILVVFLRTAIIEPPSDLLICPMAFPCLRCPHYGHRRESLTHPFGPLLCIVSIYGCCCNFVLIQWVGLLLPSSQIRDSMDDGAPSSPSRTPPSLLLISQFDLRVLVMYMDPWIYTYMIQVRVHPWPIVYGPWISKTDRHRRCVHVVAVAKRLGGHASTWGER